MKTKILSIGSHICLYCGNEIPVQFDEYQPYYECDCVDARKKREILAKIEKLEQEIPREKFEIIQKYVMYSKE